MIIYLYRVVPFSHLNSVYHFESEMLVNRHIRIIFGRLEITSKTLLVRLGINFIPQE